MYTGVRVSELINIKLTDIDFHYCLIRINNGKGRKDRIVPFPQTFKELLAMHADSVNKKQAVNLFNPPGRKNIRIGESARLWRNIQRKPDSLKIYRRTSFGTFC
nr:tyrosine-type recombinase/integrase [uncultured Brevibacillus sp.]